MIIQLFRIGNALKRKNLFFRDGTTELRYITEDNSYDFNYQEIKVFPQEVVVRQRESLQVVCRYNSIGKENFTTVRKNV